MLVSVGRDGGARHQHLDKPERSPPHRVLPPGRTDRRPPLASGQDRDRTDPPGSSHRGPAERNGRDPPGSLSPTDDPPTPDPRSQSAPGTGNGGGGVNRRTGRVGGGGKAGPWNSEDREGTPDPHTTGTDRGETSGAQHQDRSKGSGTDGSGAPRRREHNRPPPILTG
jgi:hypothetical protein